MENHETKFSVLPLLAPHKNRIIFVLFLTVILSVLAMLPPLITRSIVNRVLTGGEYDLFPFLAFAMVTAPLLHSLFSFMQTGSIAILGQRFVADIRNVLYYHLLNMSMRFYSKKSSGMLVNRLMGDSGVVQQTVTAQTISIISDLVCAVFAVSAIFLISWRMGIVVFILVTAFVINYKVNIDKIKRSTRSYKGVVDRISGGVQNRLNTTLAVKSFGKEDREHGEFSEMQDVGLGMVKTAMWANTDFNLNTMLLQQAGNSIIFFIGCAFVLSGELQYGDVIAFTAYAMQLLGPAVRFSEIARQFQDVGIALERLGELYEEENEITEPENPICPDKFSGHIEFNNVVFEYEEGNPVIKDFSLDVKPGMTVALIGPTGCGKSTILSLVMRYFDIISGELKIDGVPVNRLPLKQLRRLFGIVLQEPLLFQVSIEENIRYARPLASREEVIKAAKVAEAHEFIANLKNGYDTVIGEDGIELSVGQKQRITIARAILANPSILVMDEATSSLDSDSEHAIQCAMDRVLKDRTCLVVAHRLSTIKNSDCIVLLKDGYIAEKGTHDELMQIENGQYRHLYEQHMGKGVLEE